MSNEVTPPIVPVAEHGTRDLALYHQWKQNPSKENMSLLVKQLQPIIQKEVQRQTGTLPTPVLHAEGVKWAIDSIKSFDPNVGVKLSTHVTNGLQRLRRLNYTYQNVARLPENQRTEFAEYNLAQENLADELGREPTDAEVGQRWGKPESYVRKFKERLYKDHYESGSFHTTEMSSFNTHKVVMNEIMQNLTPEEKIIMDDMAKAKPSSSAELAAKLGCNQNRLSYLKKKLRTKIEEIQRNLSVM